MAKATSMPAKVRKSAKASPEKGIPNTALRDTVSALRGSGEKALRVGKILCRYPSVRDAMIVKQVKFFAPQMALSQSQVSRYRLLYRVPVQKWGWSEKDTAEIIAGGQQRYLSEIARKVEKGTLETDPAKVYEAAMRGGLKAMLEKADKGKGKGGPAKGDDNAKGAKGGPRGARDELILTGDALEAVRTLQKFFSEDTPEGAIMRAAKVCEEMAARSAAGEFSEAAD